MKNLYTSIDLSESNKKHRHTMFKPYTDHDGFKYCFRVESGMLVLRRDNQIFITGNCGKSTITKYLAKIFNTSWSEEYGRTYTESVLFGNDELFTKEDFEIIAKRQHDIDLETMKNSNKICFFDSDALITKFYLDRYLRETSDIVDSYIDPKKYDLVLLFTPSVKWVDDGLRLDPDNSERWKNHNKIARMYKDYGFTNIIEINEDTYYNRLKAAKNIIKEMWGI
jgi:HTH-type transcriptional repressor of NAD biosynthesis genes